MVKIIMHGCNGHMGQVISDIVEKDPDAEIVAGIDIADQGKTAIRYLPILTHVRQKQMPSLTSLLQKQQISFLSTAQHVRFRLFSAAQA